MFAGLMVGSILVSRLGDVYGRKPILAAVVFVSSVALLGILLVEELYVLFALIFVFGVTAAPRYSMAYVYASEIVSSDHESTYCMLSMIIDSFAMIVFGIYYYYVKTMYPLLIFLLCA
jgi:MFS family permease